MEVRPTSAVSFVIIAMVGKHDKLLLTRLEELYELTGSNSVVATEYRMGLDSVSVKLGSLSQEPRILLEEGKGGKVTPKSEYLHDIHIFSQFLAVLLKETSANKLIFFWSNFARRSRRLGFLYSSAGGCRV